MEEKKHIVYCKSARFSGDLLTPVSAYLRIRDQYRFPLLLESSDHQAIQNGRSLICFDPLAWVTVSSDHTSTFHYNGETQIQLNSDTKKNIDDFFTSFAADCGRELTFFGYIAYDGLHTGNSTCRQQDSQIPLAQYALYRYQVIFYPASDEIEILCKSHKQENWDDMLQMVESLLRLGQFQAHSFHAEENEKCDGAKTLFLDRAERARRHCKSGDVFQLVLSRKFSVSFSGDEFHVYRQLRRINPSPYCFYFDFGNFRLFGSSPEAQVISSNGKAEIHPIAGTAARSGIAEDDEKIKLKLRSDPKEKAEHYMLVDLARNDLSRCCDNVAVASERAVQTLSHVFHLVTRVTGDLRPEVSALDLLAASFPAGTLTGAPKHKAMDLIQKYESSPRGFYGGTIGYIGNKGTLNHAILIRSFLSFGNKLFYQAGAGIVEASVPENEAMEIENKIAVLRKALQASQSNHQNHNYESTCIG